MDALPIDVAATPQIPGPVAAARLRQLNAAAPTSLATRARRARLVGERKPVTAVFADIVGSTALAERIDPEEWVEIINVAFDEMSRCVFDYEGTIAQLLGDAIVSFFGAPVAHEDDPERAVRAALAMTEAMATYGHELHQTHGIDFKIRVGISTGPVLVGNVGSDLRYDYTAIGDTMNMASRLQGEAAPGGILISDRTARFVQPMFDLDDAGSLDLKGKTEAVRAYRVLGVASQPGSTRGLVGLASPMVGRDAELETVLQLMRTTRAGRGRIATIVAEPGLGKSRLLREAHDRIAEQDAAALDAAAEGELSESPLATAWVTGRASSFGERLPFHVITSLLLDILGMTEVSAPAEVDAALRLVIGELDIDHDEAYKYLAYQIGLPLEPTQQAEVERISTDLLSERLGGAVLRLLKGIATQGPLVVAIEDVHWADPASVQSLKGLLTLVDEAPVFIICATRDEPSAAGWGVVSAARARAGRALTEIHLEPLDHEQSSALVANLLEIESLSAKTRDLILTKAEGNPFFVEEVIRMLIDSELIVYRGGRWTVTGAADEVHIPDTLTGLILARIDRLPDRARQLLRLASCIDRQFAVPLLEDVARASSGSDDVGDALGRLEAANLLTLTATEPELEYRFSHALIQDAAYESVLHQERREWHLLVAVALVARYPDREAEIAARLARHYERGGDPQAAVHYLLMAGEQARARGAGIDAMSLFERADRLLPATSDDVTTAMAPAASEGTVSTEPIESLRARVALGRVAAGSAFMATGDTLAIIGQALAQAGQVVDDQTIGDLLRWEVHLRRMRGEQPGASPELDAALEHLDGLDEAGVDDVHLSLTLFETGRVQWARGDYQASLASLDQAIESMERRGDAIGISMAESYKGANLASLGDFAAADQHMQVSHDLAQGADRLAMIDYVLAEAGVDAIKGDYQASARHAGECLDASTELGALGCVTISGVVLGGAQMATGQGLDARQTLERSLDLANQGFLSSLRPRAAVLLAGATGMTGDAEAADLGFRAAIEELTALGNRHGLAEARLLRGLVLAERPDGDHEEALEHVQAAVSIFESLGARPNLARALRGQGLVLGLLDRVAEADDTLNAGAQLATELGLRDGPWPGSFAALAAAKGQAPLQLLDPS